MKPVLIALLVSCLAGTAFAGTTVDRAETPGHWTCMTASDAQARRLQVQDMLLPSVVFTGETRPSNIEARMAEHKVPALSVAVIRSGTLDWSAAWGALGSDGARAGCDSLFQAGSLAKPVTVLAALRMQQQGVIDFDKDIMAYLTSYTLPDGAQTDASPVTLRNLFTHTSGITPGGYDGYAQGQPIPSDVQTVRAEAPANSHKVEVLEAPGKSLVYSGGGYTAAEIALQDALKQPFEQLMQQWLLMPAGMRQADFTQPLPVASHAHTARGHRADGSVVPGGWHNHPEQAAAGLWATASDMAAFLIELHNGYQGTSEVFTQASIRELMANPIDGHAYGFRLIGEGEDVFLTHYGGTVGYRAGMTLNLRTGDGAVYLASSDNGSNLGREFLAAVSRVYQWPVFRGTEVTRTTQPMEVLQSLVGQYVFDEEGPTVAVVLENDVLTLVFPNGDHYAMTPIQGGPRDFIHVDTGVRASFDGEGADMAMQLYGQTGRRKANTKP